MYISLFWATLFSFALVERCFVSSRPRSKHALVRTSESPVPPTTPRLPDIASAIRNMVFRRRLSAGPDRILRGFRDGYQLSVLAGHVQPPWQRHGHHSPGLRPAAPGGGRWIFRRDFSGMPPGNRTR